jgi:uncharacterized protein (DUF1684 family)
VDAGNAYLELTDWRRRVAEMWAAWRQACAADPASATAGFRSVRDALFRDHPQSPLTAEARAAFHGLPYWPYHAAWRMEVRLEPEPADPGPHHEIPSGPAEVWGAGATASGAVAGPLASGAIALPSSGPSAFRFRRVGSVQLQGPLSGQRLSVFWIEGYGGGLFLPFRDGTSGSVTYGAGRYLLDTIKSADHGGDIQQGNLILDFNMAFHPSCAYDPRWDCPLAPPENRLTVPVEIGERLMG